jgi:ribonuclease Z
VRNGVGAGQPLIEVVFLGTGAAVPTRERSLPSVMVLVSGCRYLIDCGEGAQRQLLLCGLGWRAPDAILITHVHLDHIVGLIGYLATLARMGHDKPIAVHVPPGSESTVEGMLRPLKLGGMIDLRHSHLTLPNLPRGSVSWFRLTHGEVPCRGYSFSVGGGWHLSAEALRKLGVPPGPLRRRLAEGEGVVLPSGVRVLPEQVRGDSRSVARVAVAGDCGSWEELAERVRGAILLVGEATYLERDNELARANGHLTTVDLTNAAAQAGVRWLVATHLSQRYSREEYLSELRQGFPQSYLAEDCLSVGITHAGEFFQRPYHKIGASCRGKLPQDVR